MRRRKSAVEEGDDPNRSVPFNFDLSCGEDLSSLIRFLSTHALAVHDVKKPRPSTVEKINEAFNVLLANLLNAYKRSPRCFVGVSLDRSSYTVTRYGKREFGYDNFVRAHNYLVEAQPPLVSFWPGFSDRRPGGKGRTSKIKATGFLRHLINLYNSVPSSELERTDLSTWMPYLRSIQRKIHIPESWTKVAPSSEIIRLKSKDGKKLTRYDDTSETSGMRTRLSRWNDFIAQHHHVDLLKSDLEIENLYRHAKYEDEDDATSPFGDEPDRPAFVQFERFRLHRVFNNASFEDGGRLYGAWWQRIPSEARRYVTINDKPTKEFDYSNLHAAMLYAKEGLPLVDDAYSLPGISEQFRDLIKGTFFRLINAGADQRMRKPREKLLPPGYSWPQLQEAIKEKHAPIAKHLHSGIGLKLQKIDAAIAEDVMLSMMKKDYLALPIHDSFIVYSGLGELIRNEMSRAYVKIMRSKVEIKADPTFLKFELKTSPANEGDEIPSEEEEIEWRAEEDGYEGYRARRDAFLNSRTEEWQYRFGPGRGM